MSQQFPTDPERPGNAVLGPTGIGYIPTEEERRVFRECYQESFWYRSLPISVISMGFTQLLISRVAGVLGYLGGKMSYVKTCQEKFKSLENSPLGEALRQRQRHQPPVFTHKHPELSGPNKPDFEPTFQLDDQRNQSFSYTSDFTYSDPMSPATHSDTQITAEPNYIEEDVQKKHMLYEELRSKNRENYEVMTPKPETLLKPSAETNTAKRGKKNIYGDTWEE
ncbi:OCIA domain-containing protein 1-like isoform X3 [Carassius auratus]|uniref:OCIA domain-containing protein 1 n=1 Tax=Carassius auratus TaxID=7957 RepID=A0A6P6ME85_CARAU|nr:OCIA domain-containing protein 1-like isoform X3 [Carassius auratus]